MENQVIRFDNDSDLTFVNYSSDKSAEFAYRKEARLHNARRRLLGSSQKTTATTSRSNRPTSSKSQAPNAESVSLVQPLTSFARDLFSIDCPIARPNLEETWRSLFPNYFYLPSLQIISPSFPDPTSAFLSVAQANDDVYRSMVILPVVTAEANRGNQAKDAVFRNQALVIKDFRDVVDTYNGGRTNASLTDSEMQHVFASALSLSGQGFKKEAGYNAITFVVSLLMSAPQNQAATQMPIVDWLQMLMPRPGPSFNRSKAIQLLALSKIELVLDLVDSVRSGLDHKFSSYVSGYLHPSTAIYQIVTSKLPHEAVQEPYPGFYLICHHRILALLHQRFDYVSQNQPEGDSTLIAIESLANVCMQQSSPQHIALFLWCLISNSKILGLGYEQHGPFFAWAMKDLLFMHNVSFADHLTMWLLQKSQVGRVAVDQSLDLAELRRKLRRYYRTHFND